jgi:hypothetical protein
MPREEMVGTVLTKVEPLHPAVPCIAAWLAQLRGLLAGSAFICSTGLAVSFDIGINLRRTRPQASPDRSILDLFDDLLAAAACAHKEREADNA